MRTLMLALILAGWSSIALAQGMAVHELGNSTCGEAMQQIARSGRVQEAAYAHWLGGYLTGYNVALFDRGKTESVVGLGLSFDTLTALFKNKCSQDATKRVIEAAREIHQELARR